MKEYPTHKLLYSLNPGLYHTIAAHDRIWNNHLWLSKNKEGISLIKSSKNEEMINGYWDAITLTLMTENDAMEGATS